MPEFRMIDNSQTTPGPWSENPAMAAGQAQGQTLALLDGDGPGYVETDTVQSEQIEPTVKYLEETNLSFEDANVLGNAPAASGVPWWVWALIALAAANLLKGGK